MSPVRIVDVSSVAVPANAALPPEAVKLNAMEVQWLMLPLLQYIMFFEGDQLPPFDAVVQSLRSSLSATLATFAPLAGKLVHLAGTGDVAISCSASDDGVRFVVAQSDADIRRLAGDEEHDLRMLERLVPELNMSVLPVPLLAVQATRLDGGGVAVGLTVHHAVADGRSVWRFVEAWAAACRGDTMPHPPPCFDRSRVSLPGGEELARSVLRDYAPNLPVCVPSIEKEDPLELIRWIFTLDAQHIARLKQHIVRIGEAHGAPLQLPPSSFVTVIALVWTCFVRCKFVPADEDVLLLFLADVRDRLDPPAGAEYIGACLSGCNATLLARELHGERALAVAAAAAQDAIGKMIDDPLQGWDLIKKFRALPRDRLSLNVSGSSSFRAYQAAEFGWGRPRRVVPVRMNSDGQVDLVRSRDGDGVQVTMCMLQRAEMDAFKSLFLEFLG